MPKDKVGRASRRLGALLVPVIIAMGAALGSSAARPPVEPAATPAPAPAGLRTDGTNPLATRVWGSYRGPVEASWLAYLAATGEDKQLLAKIALRPKASWFGGWQADTEVAERVTNYITNAQAGDPEALVQMTIFRGRPWNTEACRRLPTRAEKASYRSWTDQVAQAIGNTPVALVIQPDAPFALCAPGGSKVPLRLMRYAVTRYAALPRATVYIEAGAADWLRDDPARALQILIPAGIEHARGVAFNGTHYDSTERQIRFGAAVVKALAARGYPDKHVVINTAQNGRPFEGYTYQGPNYDNARACRSLSDTRCVTLGIPPTTDVANPAWGLKPSDAALALAHVDAYLWFGRPWLYNQATPFRLGRALQLARTTPYDGPVEPAP